MAPTHEIKNTATNLKALVVDAEPAIRKQLSHALESEGYEVQTVESLEDGRRALKREAFDLLVLELELPDGNGLELLKNLQSRSQTQVVIIADHIGIESVSEAMRLGASDYLQKPIDLKRLKTILVNTVRTLELSEQIQFLRQRLREKGEFGPLLGTSVEMQAVYDLITQVAPTDACVLIHGESGTGKELVAQAIHDLSHRRKAPFLALNCGAISPQLMESELFGHEKGSFTGAERQHQGIFERASGGTLFLDEITEMPLELQVKLLRVLETSEAPRIGGSESVRYDVRILAATNRIPAQAVEEDKLRKDLLYRLRVFPIKLPPLRERLDDLTLLSGGFLSQLNKAAGMAKKITAAGLQSLRAHSWPGNVRELKNVIQRAFIIAADELTPEHLLSSVEASPEISGSQLMLKIGTSLAEAERYLIQATLAHCGGDKKKAVELLGISLRTLYYRLNDEAAEPAKKENKETDVGVPVGV